MTAPLRDQLRALADSIERGTQQFMMDYEKAGEGISTRIPGEAAAYIVQERSAILNAIRALLAETHPGPCGRGPCWLAAGHEGDCAPGPGSPRADEPQPETKRVTPCRRSPERDRWECITWPDKPTAYPCAHDHSHCDHIGCVEHIDGMHVDRAGDAIFHLGCDLCAPSTEAIEPACAECVRCGPGCEHECHTAPSTEDEREALCVLFHDAYEAAAVKAGWETQERSRVPWTDVPEANKATMRATADAVIAAGWKSPTEIAAHDAKVAAEAVEKVAREFQMGGWTILTALPPAGAIPSIALGQRVTDWLRERSIEAGGRA